MTTAEPLSNISLRILNKGPEYFRATSVAQGPDGRRRTAAERLEADKLKYVKSASVRQRRTTLESHPQTSQNDQATAQPLVTASTRTPITAGDVSNDVAVNNKQGDVKLIKPENKARRKVGRSNTDVDAASRRIIQRRLRPRSSTEEPFEVSPTRQKDLLSTDASGRRRNRSMSPKEGRPGKSLTAYLNKAKESLKAVTSTLAGVSSDGNTDFVKSRQPRSTMPKPTVHRSSSTVGSGLQRLKEAPSAPLKESKQPSSETVVMSPRTQLKHVRENLKKVKTDESGNFTPARQHGKTFTVVPKQNSFENHPQGERSIENSNQLLQSIDEDGGRFGSNLKRSPATENQFAAVVPGSTPSPSNSTQQKSTVNAVSRRTSTSSTAKSDEKSSQSSGYDVDLTSTSNSAGSCARRLSSQNLKRRSLDLAHSTESSLQLSLSKANVKPTSLTPDADVMLCNPLTSQSRQRKSWSRYPPSSSDSRRSGNKTSLPEESNQNRPGSRKSITEALEEILNPLERDDDTAYNSMSPDASVECKTLVAPSTQSFGENSGTFVAANLSSLLRVRKTNDFIARPKTPESSRSKTPTCDDAVAYSVHDADLRTITETSSSPERHRNSSPDSPKRHRTICRTDVPFEITDKSHCNVTNPIPSQPLNRIDLAPTVSPQLSMGPSSSPMLAPRARREVAPDFSFRCKPNVLSRSVSREEHANTMKSQNTSSSNSGDMNKPLTALTASDLKPRRVNRSNTQQPIALKPTTAYPMKNYRGSPKRHNNTPVSPTLSPNKQAARMTPPQSSSSSTPHSSLKRTPTSSRNSSLKRHRQRSKSDVSVFPNELDRFFSSMGMNEGILSPLPVSPDTLFTTAHVSSESDFSFAGASAYVRDGPDDAMEVDRVTTGLASAPSVSIIEKNARVMRWLMSCKKSMATNSIPRSPKHAPTTSVMPSRPQPYNTPMPQMYPSYPPPVPPRVSSYQTMITVIPKESDV